MFIKIFNFLYSFHHVTLSKSSLLCLQRVIQFKLSNWMLKAGQSFHSSAVFGGMQQKNTLFHLNHKTNICLIGSPGSGKSTIGKLLAKLLSLQFLDVDDDHLEKVWNCSVSKKLADVGDEQFIIEEGKAVMLIDRQNTVISTSGSTPLYKPAIDHLRKSSILVYLDVDDEEILQRCHKMKVDRIVGQATKSLREILAFRRTVYEKIYDIRVLIPVNESVDNIAKQVLCELEKNEEFVSVCGKLNRTYYFCDVLRTGLAPDGGLFMPQYFPQFSLGQFKRLVNLSFQER